MRFLTFIAALSAGLAWAQDEAPEVAPEADAPPAPEAVVAEEEQERSTLGMSILGNEEAPKSLVIVPWKSSRIGDGLGVTNSMDDRPSPVDRDVFMREVHYYELRSGGAD